MNHDENKYVKGNRQYDMLTKGRKEDTFIVTGKPVLKRIIRVTNIFILHIASKQTA